MAWGVAVFGAECRSESVDGTECCGTEFALKLTTHGERSHLSEEVVVVLDAAALVFVELVEVFGGHLEHFASAFAVACSDDW